MKLKFREDIPIRLENALVALGFTYYARYKNKWVIYEKLPDTNLDQSGVPLQTQEKLRLRLQKVIDCYLDPYSNVPAIHNQCMMIANGLPELQRTWVIDWITTNLDAEFFQPPWESEDNFDPEQPGLGFC